jgi:hypothetical protein
VTTWRSWPVFRRSIKKHGRGIEREFIWFVELDIVFPVRRIVIDALTGEIIDEVWLDDEGRVRSYSAPRPSRMGKSDPPNRGQSRLVEAVEPPLARPDDEVIEDGGDDGSLSGQGQVAPRLPQSGCVADMPLNDRNAA